MKAALAPRENGPGELCSGLSSILLFALFFLIAALFAATFLVASSTEAREIHIARLMYEGHSWILPTRNGLVPSKPPFFHWCSAIMGFFSSGVSPASVRGISILSGMVLACLVYLEVVRWSRRRQAALLSVLILLSSPMYVRLLLDARVDMLFSCCVFFAYFASGSSRRGSVHLFSIATAMAILTKGPLGLILVCLLTLGAHLATGRSRGFIDHAQSHKRALLWFLLPLLWYFAAYLIGKQEFLWRVLFENMDRFLSGADERKLTFFLYLNAFFTKLAPWSLLALLILFRDIRKLQFRKLGMSRRQSSFLCFTLGMVFFSFSEGKRASYLLPLLPFLAMYVGVSLGYSRAFYRGRWFLHLPLVLWLALFFALAAFVLYDSYFFSDAVSLSYLSKHWLLVLVSMVFLLVFAFACRQEELRGFRMPSMHAFYFSFFVLIAYSLGLGIKSYYKNFELIADEIERYIDPGQQLLIVKQRYEEYFDPLQLLLDRVVQVHTADDLPASSSTLLIMREDLPRLSEIDTQQLADFSTPSDRRKQRTRRDILLLSRERQTTKFN